MYSASFSPVAADADDVLRLYRQDPEAMVASIQEQTRNGIRDRSLTRAAANEILAETKDELGAEGHQFDDQCEVGIMVERTAAVMIAEDIPENRKICLVPRAIEMPEPANGAKKKLILAIRF